MYILKDKSYQQNDSKYVQETYKYIVTNYHLTCHIHVIHNIINNFCTFLL